MMPNINVSDQVLKDLGTMAIPFVDHEPQDVIKRLIVYWRSSHVANDTATGAVDSGIKVFAPDAPPDLTFTKIRAFKIEGQQVVEKAALYWNPILFAIVAKAAKKLGSSDLKKSLVVNYVDGEGQQEKGYRYIPEAKLSVQGSDANTVWKAIFQVARAAGMTLEVEFTWEDKPKAAFPNAIGRFTYDGK